MRVYKRGRVYWYKFLFQGQLIRDSAKTNSKTVAKQAERGRRHQHHAAEAKTKTEKQPSENFETRRGVRSATL